MIIVYVIAAALGIGTFAHMGTKAQEFKKELEIEDMKRDNNYYYQELPETDPVYELEEEYHE